MLETDTLRNTWYPVVLSRDLTNDEPYGLQILGFPIVVWRHKGKAVCVEDICPHRSAPLSVGRIVNGVLECKYHGWQFGEKGECTFIPSAPHKDPPQSSHCNEIPSMEKHGAVWIWIGENVSKEERDKRFPEFLFNYQNDPTFVENSAFRDVEIDHGLMIENLLDPAHLPFTHEGTLAKRKDAQRMEMELKWNTLTRDVEDENDYDFVGTKSIGQKGFKVETFRPNAAPDKVHAGYFCFVAPYILKLEFCFNKEKGTKMVQLQFCVPITPTRMRLVFFFYRNVGQISKLIPGSNRLFRYYSDKIIDQDLELLGGQQVRLNQGARPWNTSVSADMGGVIYRKWREKVEKSNPWFGGFSAESYLKKKAQLQEGKMVDIENLMLETCPSRFAEPPSSRFDSSVRTSLIDPQIVKFGKRALIVSVIAIFTYLYITKF